MRVDIGAIMHRMAVNTSMLDGRIGMSLMPFVAISGQAYAGVAGMCRASRCVAWRGYCLIILLNAWNNGA
jgi:hypothetical protein